jgi:MFS transporter, NNP family, nitrate/nitrite transporter
VIDARGRPGTQGLIGSLRSGNWRSLLACFLYFDTGFAVWVMWGALAPFIAAQLGLDPAESAFLVAVPVLAASIVRIALGNLFQCVEGRRLALLCVALSALPSLALLVPVRVTYDELLLLGMFLGVAGGSFAIALPMAGSSYPAAVQGLVLGLAAAGNVGAVLDGFLFPWLAQHLGWQRATAAALPLLLAAALALYAWADDRSVKAGSRLRAWSGFAVAFAGLTVLVLAASAGLLAARRTDELLLPLLGLLLALAVLPRRYLTVLREGDAWLLMLVYAITFGGFVGMSSYATLLLTIQYGIARTHAGVLMAGLSLVGALLRPVGGLLADRMSGVRALLWLLPGIALCNFIFAVRMPPLVAAAALLLILYVCLGLGNGATFQLVPLRWKGRTGLMTGMIGAAGGIGGFYLPVALGIARQSTGSYQSGFALFGALPTVACLLLLSSQRRWRVWALPRGAAAARVGAAAAGND